MAPKKAGLSEGDLARIENAILRAIEPIAKKVQTHGETLFGVEGGAKGLVTQVEAHEAHKNKMTAYVVVATLLIPAVVWAADHFFK